MERTKEHVEYLESGGAVCKHCGGSVDGDGYSAEEVAETELSETDDDGKTPQLESRERLRSEGGFADAVRRRER